MIHTREKPGSIALLFSTILSTILVLGACLPPSPPDQPAPSCSAMVRWTINGMVPDDALCRGLTAIDTKVANMEIWENADLIDSGGSPACSEAATNDFFVYRFECAGGVCQNAETSGLQCMRDDDCCPSSGGCEGSGYCLKGAAKTKNFLFAAVPTCIKTVLFAHSPSPAADYATDESILAASLAVSGSYVMWTPDAGSNCTLPSGELLPACTELAQVDFVLPDYVPLTVGLSWESAQPPAGEFGGCSASSPPVYYMGYALSNSNDQVWDSVQVESHGNLCQDEISWKLIPNVLNETLGVTYSLEVWGIDENQTLQWNATCSNLIVDAEPHDYRCEVSILR